jgi:hypothetical protein
MGNSLTTFSGRIPSQNEHELRSFIRLLQSRNVTSYLEIGAREGDTFHEIMTNLPPGSRGVAIDLPGGLWGKSSTAMKLKRAIQDLKKRGYVASYWLGDSTADSTRTIVRMRGPYGAVLIDGDHTYEGVSYDFKSYGDAAPIVAFHDIVGTGQAEKKHGMPVEVPRLWEEIKVGRNFVEYIDEGSKMGIGVLLS